jgi:hypothetical protein
LCRFKVFKTSRNEGTLLGWRENPVLIISETKIAILAGCQLRHLQDGQQLFPKEATQTDQGPFLHSSLRVKNHELPFLTNRMKNL